MKVQKKGDAQSGPDPIDVHVGSRIRLRRTLLGMSQEKLSDRLGITFQQVQKYENGTNRVGASRLFAICRILGVPSNYFFDGYIDSRDTSASVAESTPDIDKFLASKETVDLVRAYYAIDDAAVRRKVFEMIKSLGSQKISDKSN